MDDETITGLLTSMKFEDVLGEQLRRRIHATKAQWHWFRMAGLNPKY